MGSTALNLEQFFLQTTTDFCGRIKISSERAEWSRLFRSKDEVFSLTGNEHDFLAFCRKFVESNCSSGNLLVLIEHTVSRLRQIRANILKKTRSPAHLVEQCCVALHLTGLIFNYMSSTQTRSLLIKVCAMHQDWPHHSSENDSLYKSFVDELLSAINGQAEM